VHDKAARERPPRNKKSKKMWEPPRLKSGQLFESNSLACGKNSGATQQCMINGSVS
jgi:hypothetical protein